MIGVIDHGAGNLQSIANALDALELGWARCTSPSDVAAASRLLIPGVGHFGAAAGRLAAAGLHGAIRDHAAAGRPVLGICLGMQLLFAASDEDRQARGLGLLPGETIRLTGPQVPHMGWSEISLTSSSDLLPASGHFYFAHGFAARLNDADLCLATVRIDACDWPAAVGKDRIAGVQFHPEKSGAAGLAVLEAFARW